MTDELVERIIELAADVLGESPGVVTRLSAPNDIESWDSLAQLNLVVALEDEFSISITPEDVEQMVNIEAIAILVSSRCAG